VTDLRKAFGFQAQKLGFMYELHVEGEDRRHVYTSEASLKAALEQLVRDDPHVRVAVRQVALV
jgi:hypothetical protein